MPILRALCLLIFALGAPAGAEVEVGVRVPGSADLTYADLLKQVVPDLALADGEATGTQVQPLRHIAEGFGGDPPANVAIRTVHTLALEAEGRRRLLVLAHLGASEDRVEETVVLALFDQEPSPKLLDAVDVGMDRFTSLGQPPLLRIGPKDEAIVTTSSHHNSHQSYRTTALLAVQGDGSSSSTRSPPLGTGPAGAGTSWSTAKPCRLPPSPRRAGATMRSGPRSSRGKP